MLYGSRHLYSIFKTEDIYAGIAKNVAATFDTSNYELDRPLLKEKNKKVIGLMKDGISWKIMKNVTVLLAKTCRYLTDNNDEDKRGSGTKKSVTKRKLNSKSTKTV